jgi:glutamate carboxypeptidase
MPETPGNAALFRRLQETAGRLGQTLPKEHRRGTSDANFFGAAGVPTLDGLGPIGDKDHTPREFIKISSLRERTGLLAVFLWEFGQPQRNST